MIDTAEKRRSAAGVPFFVVAPGVTPDAGQGAQWRTQSGWGYSGNVPDDGGEEPAPSEWLIRARRRARR